MSRPRLPNQIGPLPTRLALGALVGLVLVWALLASLERPSRPAPPATASVSAERDAEPLGAPPRPVEADPFEWPGSALDLTLKLLAVLALAYGALAAVRRYSLGLGGGRPSSSLEVLESATLAPNRVVYLVRARERCLLLGVTPTQITALASWDGEPSGLERGLGSVELAPTSAPSDTPLP